MLFYEQPESSRLYNTVQEHCTAFANIKQVTQKIMNEQQAIDLVQKTFKSTLTAAGIFTPPRPIEAAFAVLEEYIDRLGELTAK